MLATKVRQCTSGVSSIVARCKERDISRHSFSHLKRFPAQLLKSSSPVSKSGVTPRSFLTTSIRNPGIWIFFGSGKNTQRISFLHVKFFLAHFCRLQNYYPWWCLSVDLLTLNSSSDTKLAECLACPATMRRSGFEVCHRVGGTIAQVVCRDRPILQPYLCPLRAELDSCSSTTKPVPRCLEVRISPKYDQQALDSS